MRIAYDVPKIHLHSRLRDAVVVPRPFVDPEQETPKGLPVSGVSA